MERFGPTRRGGPLFRWLGEPLAIDLANTIMVVREGQSIDLLATPDDLRLWLDTEQERLGDSTFAVAHLEEIQELRDAVRALLLARAEGERLPTDALARLNATSRGAAISPQLEADAHGTLTIVETPAGGRPIAALLAQLARAAIALLFAPESERLRVCTAPSCGMLFLGARRWCCAACGNRARAARHYRRRAKQRH